jgi:hypothetical protein
MMRRKLLTIFNSALAPFAALLLATLLASSVHAQTAPAQTHDTQTRRAAEESGAEPDLSINAHVTADSLRFENQTYLGACDLLATARGSDFLQPRGGSRV